MLYQQKPYKTYSYFLYVIVHAVVNNAVIQQKYTKLILCSVHFIILQMYAPGNYLYILKKRQCKYSITK